MRRQRKRVSWNEAIKAREAEESANRLRIGVTFAALSLKKQGWTLKADGNGWEATKGDTCFVVSDARDLLVFEKEVREGIHESLFQESAC